MMFISVKHTIFDGLSIEWAVSEYLTTEIGSRTIFAIEEHSKIAIGLRESMSQIYRHY
jgi:hypothetical protein